jgi:hypothetical protein
MSALIVGSKKGKGEGWKEDVVNGKDVDLPKGRASDVLARLGLKAMALARLLKALAS